MSVLELFATSTIAWVRS